MAPVKSEKRRVERYAYPSRIEYALDASDASASEDIFKAVTINISETGMSMYAFSRLPEGQEIVIKSGLPVDYRTATIRWIKEAHQRMYKIGLKFMKR
jgi:hypothetical protein